MSGARDRHAVLVLRVWWDAPGDGGLRGRCLASDDPNAEPHEVGVAAGREAILAMVDSWLQGRTHAKAGP